MSQRDFDVVVFGATGLTGRHVAAYLQERAAASGLRWAAAGRDEAKLARVLSEEGASEASTLLADVEQADSLRDVASRATVVLNLVGPYTPYGRPVIEACVAGGCHYADLTGEIPFVRGVLDVLDQPAREAGVKVAQVCGFEALPPDLATLLAADAARERYDEPLQSVDVEVSITAPPGLPRPSDAISGGTLQSVLAIAASERSDLIADPAALITDAQLADAVRSVSPIAIAPRHAHGDGVIAPMAPAPFINPAVVHRSAALAAAAAGVEPMPFRYREGMVLGGPPATLPLRWGLAGAMSATQAGLRSFASAAPSTRRRLTSALSRIVPGSGYGPKGERLQAWRWQLRVFARTLGGRELEVSIDADGHPGYLATARMLGELGILLAEDGATPDVAGCVTPAIALGSASAPRFAHAGVRFSVSAP
ncbi:MAG TPA: saccharopine dehydrogenase NADP-binding domain-containing protein [Solirubrobacteraceae bacterium]|nr:saccharopine dehydrogenase NADP-binding domain-containing protein [Solirubrobacteraceae bacterium]